MKNLSFISRKNQNFIMIPIIILSLLLISGFFEEATANAKVAWIHHGNQALNDSGSLAGSHNARPGYWATLDSHNYNSCPVDLHMSGSLMQSYRWMQNDNGLVSAMANSSQAEIAGSFYAQHIAPYVAEDLNIFSMQYFREIWGAVPAAGGGAFPGTVNGYSTNRPVTVWIPERTWKDYLISDVARSFGYNGAFGWRPPVVVLDGPTAHDWYCSGCSSVSSNKIHSMWDGSGNQVYVAFIDHYANEHWLNGDFDTNPDNSLRQHLAWLNSQADQETVAIYGDDWEKAAGVADWWNNTAEYDANIYYVSQGDGASWIDPIHISEAAEWWGSPAEDFYIPYASYPYLQDWTGGSYDFWYDDSLTGWGKESIVSTQAFSAGLTATPEYDPNSNGIYGDFEDLILRATDKLRANSGIDLTGAVYDFMAGHTYPSETGGILTWMDNPPSYPADFGNRINKMGFVTLLGSLYELGWHNGSEVWNVGWGKDNWAHARHAEAYAHGAYWLDNLPAQAEILTADFDGDGQDEYAVQNDKICAIFEREGGRALWVFNSDGDVIVGNSMSDWGGGGGIGADEDDGGHPGLFQETDGRNNWYFATVNTAGPTSEVSITFNMEGGGISKTIRLATGDSYLAADYDTSSTVYIEAGVTPDIEDNLKNGYNLSYISGITANGHYYGGFENNTSNAKGTFLYDNGFFYTNKGKMSSVAEKIEVGGKSGTFTVWFYAGRGAPDGPAGGSVDDTSGPVISGISQNPVAANVGDTDDVTVQASITDSTGVAEAWVRYTLDGWDTWNEVAMSNPSGDTYEGVIPAQTEGTEVKYVLRAVDSSDNSNESWENNGGLDYIYNVILTYAMDGVLDAAALELAFNGVHIWVHYNGISLYVATEAAGSGSDHYLFLAEAPGDMTDRPWGDPATGQAALWDVYLADENDNDYEDWRDPDVSVTYDSASSNTGWAPNGGVLEGFINLSELYTTVPSGVYLAVGGWGTNAEDTLNFQCPAAVQNDHSIEANEYVYFSLESTAPESVLNEYLPDPDNDATPTYTGSASDSQSAIGGVQYRIDGGSWIEGDAADGTFDSLVENFTFTTATLADGPHTFETRAYDVGDNFESTYASDTLTIDTIAPDTVINQLATNPTSDLSPTFTGTATEEDGSISVVTAVEYRVDGGEWGDADPSDGAFNSAQEQFSFNTGTLTIGSHNVETRALDTAGNWETSYFNRPFEIHDVSAPSFSGLDSISGGNGFADLYWSAAIDLSEPITYNIYQATATGTQNFGTPSYTTVDTDYRVPSLLNGQEYFFVVRAEDFYGNEDLNTNELSVTPSDAAPTISAITPASGNNNGTVAITDLAGANFQSGAEVTLTYTGQSDITATDVVVVGSGQITCTFNIIGALDGAWTVRVTNPDDQTGTLAGGFTVIDVTPPVFAGIQSVFAGSGFVNLNWTAASDLAEPIVYSVYTGDSALTIDYGTAIMTTTLTAATVTGLTNGEEVFFAVRAMDDNDNEESNIEVLGATPQENMASGLNMSFEEDAAAKTTPPVKWESSNDLGSGITEFGVCNAAAGEVHSGNYAAYIKSTPDGSIPVFTSSLVTSVSVPLERHKVYEFSAYVKSSHQQWIRLVMFDNGFARSLLYDIAAGSSPNEWEKIIVTYSPDANTSYFLRVDSLTNAADPEMVLYVDDISLTEITSSLTQINVPNGNLEQGTHEEVINSTVYTIPNGWKGGDPGTNNGTGYPFWDVLPTGGHNGSQGFMLQTESDGVGASIPQFYRNWMPIEAGKENNVHEMRGWIYTENRPVVRIFMVGLDFNRVVGLILRNGSSPTSWREYRVRFAPETAFILMRYDNIVLPSMTGDYTVFVDDTTLYVEE